MLGHITKSRNIILERIFSCIITGGVFYTFKVFTHNIIMAVIFQNKVI